MSQHRTDHGDEGGAIEVARYTIYGLLGSALVAKVVSLGFGLLSDFGRGQVSSDAQAHSYSHSLADVSGTLAMAGFSLGFLYAAYLLSRLFRGSGYAIDDGSRNLGIVRFACEGGVIAAAGVGSLLASSSAGHGFVGFIALMAAVVYVIFRAIEFFGPDFLWFVRGRVRGSGLHRAVGSAAQPAPGEMVRGRPREDARVPGRECRRDRPNRRVRRPDRSQALRRRPRTRGHH